MGNHQTELNQADCTATNKPRQHHSLTEKLDFECSEILKQETMILDFPPEIISFILIRLPVKTLSVLKCVNTYFTRFVSSKEFITAHLKLSSEDAAMSCYNVIFGGVLDSELEQTSVQSLCYESPIDVVELDYPKKELQKTVRVVGSCDGLVVIIVNHKQLFIWNPATRKYQILPNIVGHKNLDDDKPRFYCGIGFDASNDDYKVVVLFGCPVSMFKLDFCYEVNVYSLKTNSWIRIPDFRVGEIANAYGKFASGKLHWCTMHGGDIVSFDVERDVFGTLDHPKYAEGCSPMLCVIGGSITVCCYYDGHVDVWVMKEYGMVVSWTKMFTLLGGGDHSSIPQFHSIMPNGEILVDYGFCGFYNPKDGSSRSTEIYFDYDPVFYVESLVSPCCN